MPASASANACAVPLRQIAWFAAGVALLSIALSLPVLPFTSLPWWRVARRCVSISAAVVLWVMAARGASGHPWHRLGLTPWREGKRPLLHGFVLGFTAVLAMVMAYLAFGVCKVSIAHDQWRLWRTIVAFLPGSILVGILEELIFRGYLLQQLLTCSRALAILGTSASYALVHLKPDMTWPGSILELIGLFVLGAVLAVTVLRIGHLYLAIGLHASLAYWGRLNKLLIAFPTHSSLQWLVGTSRLVNGLIAWLMLVLLGLAVARWYRQVAVVS